MSARRHLVSGVAFVAVVTFFAADASAFDVAIDDYSSAVNTVQVTVPLGMTSDETDSGLAVLGGSRQVIVESPGSIGTEGGVDLGGGEVLRIMSFGPGAGSVRAIYDGDGAGLGNAIGCATDFSIDFTADEVDQATVVVEIEDGGGGVASVSQVVPVGAGTLSYLAADFAGVDLTDIASVAVVLDGIAGANDFTADAFRATCPDVPAPAPALSNGMVALALMMLSGLGFLAIRRRSSL